MKSKVCQRLTKFIGEQTTAQVSKPIRKQEGTEWTVTLSHVGGTGCGSEKKSVCSKFLPLKVNDIGSILCGRDAIASNTHIGLEWDRKSDVQNPKLSDKGASRVLKKPELVKDRMLKVERVKRNRNRRKKVQSEDLPLFSGAVPCPYRMKVVVRGGDLRQRPVTRKWYIGRTLRIWAWSWCPLRTMGTKHVEDCSSLFKKQNRQPNPCAQKLKMLPKGQSLVPDDRMMATGRAVGPGGGGGYMEDEK